MCGTALPTKSTFETDTLIIDRAQHLTGNAYKHLDTSGLRLNSCGLKCCLGFYGEQKLGMDEHELNQQASIPRGIGPEASWLFQPLDENDRIISSDITVQDALISANDDYAAHPIRREARIAKLFKKYGGINVKFVGDRGKATRAARAVAA
jgi:hypothetical protein